MVGDDRLTNMFLSQYHCRQGDAPYLLESSSATDHLIFRGMICLTCRHKCWLTHKEHLERVPKLCLPVSVCPEDLLFADGLQVSQGEAWCGPRNMSELQSGLPVGTIAGDLNQE